MSHKILFTEEVSTRFHEINFFEKITSKVTTNDANADQITFIISLIHGYDKDYLFDERTEMSVKTNL